MPSYPFEIVAMLSELENGTFLAEALFFPELCRFEATAGKALDNLRNSLTDLLDTLPTVALHRLRAPSEVEVRDVSVVIPPPRRDPCWSEPVTLTFFAVAWQQRGRHHAFVPGLTVEAIGDSPDQLAEALTQTILQELQRQGCGTVQSLLRMQRVVGLAVQRSEVDLEITSLRRKANEQSPAGPNPALLKDLAVHLNPLSLSPTFEMDGPLRRLASMLTGSQSRSVLLVGPSGLGKTALTRELVRQRHRLHLGTVGFWETTGSRLLVGQDGFGDWQERCRQVVAQASSGRAVLLLGNLFELAEVARHASTPQGMAGFFRPYIERGDLHCIVECTPQQRDLLERDHPHLLTAFSVMSLDPPKPETCRSILRQAVPGRVTDDGIRAAESLHRRYARYSAYPGRPLHFLQELISQTPGTEPLGAPEVAAAFAAETGLPRFIVDDSQSLDLKAVHQDFRRQILGQDQAVRQVVDLLAGVKACLSPHGRPIASLLLIGPTGVGKTEMARALAGYLFRDSKRMVRFDMSEFADPLSVERLIGGQGAGQGLLTARVREQPFGVVLFDELEKADPAFFDLLLQILGEGRLTDEAGRVADFTNAVIVMTSNLGAAAFSKGPLGFRDTSENVAEQARQDFTSAVKAAFRPELFNRIDRLIPFAPLSRETATAVARRELDRLRTRDGLTTDKLTLEVEGEVADYLANLAYDRRYGARPLKRAIERLVLEPLASIAGQAADRKTEVKIHLLDGKLRQMVTSHLAGDAETSEQAMADQAMMLRRQAQRLGDGQACQHLRNQVQRLQRLRQRKERGQHLAPELLEQLLQLPSKEKQAAIVQAVLQQCQTLETKVVLALKDLASTELEQELAEQERMLATLMLDLYAARFDNPEQATLVVYCEPGLDPRSLLRAYHSLWQSYRFTAECFKLSLQTPPSAKPMDETTLFLNIGDPGSERTLCCQMLPFQECFSPGCLGVAFQLAGSRVLPLMAGEAGIHAFGSSMPRHLEVEVLAGPLSIHTPPSDLHLRKRLTGSKRRTYNAPQGHVEDHRLDLRRPWNGKGLEEIIADLVSAELTRAAREACL